jgi:hypothetical protein
MVRVAAIHMAYMAHDVNALVDDGRYARAAYGVADEENITFVIRPDGHIGHIANDDWMRSISMYLESVAGFSLSQEETSQRLRVMHG